MDLKIEDRAGLDSQCRTRLENHRICAGSRCCDQRARQFAVIAGIPELRRNLREAWRSPSAGLSTEDEHVMNNGSRAWANLDRLNPFVLFEVCRRFEELVIDCARLGDVKLFRHADD